MVGVREVAGGCRDGGRRVDGEGSAATYCARGVGVVPQDLNLLSVFLYAHAVLAIVEDEEGVPMVSLRRKGQG